MVNLRQRTAAVVKQSANKRTSSRTSKNEEKVIIESSGSESSDIELSESERGNDSVLDGYITENSEPEPEPVEDEDDMTEGDSFDIEVDDEDLSGSEDDKEIKRIIEKTEAETRNIPLTARQRAKLTNEPFESDIKAADTSALTDEQALRKSEKSRRRKLQREAKVEETKRATIDRLLQKQKKPTTSPDSTEEELNESKKSEEDGLKPGIVRFIDNSSGSKLQFADPLTLQDYISDFNGGSKRMSNAKNDLKCQICGKNPSKYVHPSKGTSYCSLSCYKLIN